MMKNIVLLLGAILLNSFVAIADSLAKIDSIEQYRRSSLYLILLEHPGLGYDNEIKTEFLNIPFPERYNEHNLSVRSFIARRKGDEKEAINKLIDANSIGRRMVARWFNREKETGAFNVELIKERGLYDASVLDNEIAQKSARGTALLEDAGEELINNTFVLFCDITYVDKEKKYGLIGSVLSVAGAAVGAAGSISSSETTSAISTLVTATGDVTQLIAGFKVKVTTYLYRLVWSKEDAGIFYQNYYYDKNNMSLDKKASFDKDQKYFKLKYVGEVSSASGKTVLKGVGDNGQLIRKVCARALDENIVMLQREYDVFKIKCPIYEITGDEIHCPIGLKEGVESSSKYEVLERYEDEHQKVTFKRVGIIKPKANQIWDNRFMAAEEGAVGADLKYTTFTGASGKDFYPGMLIREIK